MKITDSMKGKSNSLNVVSYNKNSEEFSNNVKYLEEFVEEYKKGGSKGFICFRLDRNGENCHPIISWDKGSGTSMLGALELVKNLVMKTLLE